MHIFFFELFLLKLAPIFIIFLFSVLHILMLNKHFNYNNCIVIIVVIITGVSLCSLVNV